MKVLLLAPMSSVHERFGRAGISALRALGCEIHLAANFSSSAHDKAYGRRMEAEGFLLHDLPFARHSLKKNLHLLPGLRRLLREEAFDLVHCHTETGGILTRLAMSAAGETRYLYAPHGMSFYKGSSLKSQLLYRPVEKWICAGMQKNLAMNGEELELLQKWNPETAGYIHGVGLDVEGITALSVDRAAKRAELGVPEGAVLLLSVGELNENKNHRVVLEALSRLPHENLCYMICGEGDRREALRRQAEASGIRLLLPGYRYDVREILKIADLFLFPSFHEGLPVSIMEAMAAGLPVVCSDIRGNIDLIRDGENGLLCAPNDADGFAKAISALLCDSALAERMAARSREVVADFSLPRVTCEMQEIYEGVLQPCRKTHR